MALIFTCLQTRQANSRLESSAAVGARLRHDLARARPRPAPVASRSCTTKPPPTRLNWRSAWLAASHAPVASRRRFFFARSRSSAPRREARRDDALEEGLGEQLGRRVVDLAVERDDAAERAHRVGFARRAVGVGERAARSPRRTGSCA